MPLEPNPANTPQGGEGGEWQLLLSRLSAWLNTVEPDQLLSRSQRPLQWAAGLLSLLIVLKIIAAVRETIDSMPTLGGLLELVGVIWLLRFCTGHLLRRDDREQTLTAWGDQLRRVLQRN